MNDFEVLQFMEVKEQIAAYCRFSLGRKKLLDVTPAYEYLQIKQENMRTQEAIACCTRYGMVPLPGLYDISTALSDARRDKTLRPFELKRIAMQGSCVKTVENYQKEVAIATPYLDDLYHAFGDVSHLCKAINDCINTNEEVVDQASAKLASLRKSIRLCEGDISKEVQRFISANHSKLMDTITTTRGGRVCVLMKISEKNSVRGFVHGESASGQTAYVEPEALLQLNNKLASLMAQEQEEVERILFMLSQQVKQHVFALMSNQDTFALLDLYFAKADYALKQDACIAVIEEKGDHIYLKEARHPLIDAQKIVANTYEIKPPFRSLLITGSNTGGKTVTLKTIGLAACMAQSGLPILAQEAILPLFSDIFVDIGDDQSIQESLSTFSAHVSKLAYICEHVSEHSLILLDELGSGTDPKEGESLAIAVLDELRTAHAFVLATTHYSALKTYAKQQADILISSVEFDVEHMVPTYRYLAGISGTSNALAIARRYHMKESILNKAKQIQISNQTQQDDLMEKLEQELLAAETKHAQMEKEWAAIMALRNDLEQQKSRFEQTKQKQLEKIKADYALRLEETLQQGETIIKELKTLGDDVKPHVIDEIAHRLHALDNEEEVPAVKTNHEFQIGDTVMIQKMNAHGEIIEINKDKVCVLINGLRMNTKTSDLTFIHTPPKTKQAKEKGYGVKRTSSSFSMELNVIGMNVSEALPVIDKYLDNALLAKLSTVRIIHGNGTGALRKGIHQYLKKDAKVESYRLGGQGEGGTGATVVTLKKRGKPHG